MPDPQDPATFERSRLDWAELEKEPHADLLDWYRRLIAVRRTHPSLTDGRLDRVRCTYDERARWFVLHRDGIAAVCNLAAERQTVPVGGTPAGVAVSSSPGFVFRAAEVELEAESVVIVTLVSQGARTPVEPPEI